MPIALSDVRFGRKADIQLMSCDVSFRPKADIDRTLFTSLAAVVSAYSILSMNRSGRDRRGSVVG